jgi:hypothetical protein
MDSLGFAAQPTFSAINPPDAFARPTPDSAALHPGYGFM